MNLNNNIISQFVKITNDNSRKNDLTTAYGKAILKDGSTYVQLDGSELLMPVDNTVHIRDGERVIVSIRNHNATIDGNISDVSASNDIVINMDGNVSDLNDVVDYVFLEMVNSIDALDVRVTKVEETNDQLELKTESIEKTVGQLTDNIDGKVDEDDVRDIIADELNGYVSLKYLYEAEIEVPASSTTKINLPSNIPANIDTKYSVMVFIKTYSFGSTWDGLITQRAIAYADNKTNSSFDIVTDITALKTDDFSKVTNGTAIIKYIIIA